MKTITGLSSLALLVVVLGCADPTNSPPASSSPEEEVQATNEAGAINSMDFESGKTPVSSEPEAMPETHQEADGTGDDEDVPTS